MGNKEVQQGYYRYNTYIVDNTYKEIDKKIIQDNNIEGYKLFIVCSKENATNKQIDEDIETVIKEVITYIESAF